MKLSAILAPLVAAKADHQTIMSVVLAFEADRHALIASLVPAGKGAKPLSDWRAQH